MSDPIHDLVCRQVNLLAGRQESLRRPSGAPLAHPQKTPRMRLSHHPKTKQQIGGLLCDYLYQPVQAAFRKQLKEIIARNCELQRTVHPSMTYRGETYVAQECITAPPKQVTPLHQDLTGEMDDYLKEIAHLNAHELPYVLGYINQVLGSSDDLQDYLRLLPEGVHGPIQQLIATCGCRTTHLSDHEVCGVTARHAACIALLKERLTRNPDSEI